MCSLGILSYPRIAHSLFQLQDLVYLDAAKRFKKTFKGGEYIFEQSLPLVVTRQSSLASRIAMSEMAKVALLTSHMWEMKTRMDALVGQQMQERCEFEMRVKQLQKSLWEKEAALNDAERELLFVKNTAVRAIRKLGTSIRERDEAISKLHTLEQEKNQSVVSTDESEWEAV